MPQKKRIEKDWIERIPADTAQRVTAWRLHGPMAPTDWQTITEAAARRDEPALSPGVLAAIDVHGITAMRDLSMRQHAEYRAVEGLRNRRRFANEPSPTVQTQMRQRIAARVRSAVRLAYHRCSYRHSESRWAGGVHDIVIEIVDCGSKVNATGETSVAWSHNRKWRGTDSRHKISVPLNWIVNIERRGIAVVDGLLTLGAWLSGERLAPTEEAWRALYVTQGRGIGLVTRAGLLYRRGGGPWLHATTLRGARSMATQHEASLTANAAAEVMP